MDPQIDEPDLRSYLGTISRRRWLVAGVTLLFFGLAVALSVLAEPKYELRLHVQTRGEPLDTGLTPERRAEVELGHLGSSSLAREVERAYDGPLTFDEILDITATDISRNQNEVSNLVELALVTPNPEEGRYLLRLYADTYVEKVEAEDTERVQKFVAAHLEDITTIEQEIDQVEAPLRELSDEIAATGSAQLEEQREELRQDLQPELNSLRTRKADLQREVSDLQLLVRTGSAAEARTLGLVAGSGRPISPDIPQNLAIGLVFGLFLGVAAAFMREYFDDSVKSKEIVERVTGVPAMGLIPRFDTSHTELVAAAASTSPATEAFRSLRTSVKFMGVDRDVRIVQVTSASAGEGKTVTATNLATVLAQAGDRVVLVGADLRRPRVEELVGAPMSPGLTGVLIGEVTLPQAILAVDGVPNLSVLPSGQPPTNPSELLSGERARRLVEVLTQTYDFVILDCPPLLPVTDSLVLARMADTTLLVTSARQTSRRELTRAVELLNQMEANLAGCVVTSLDPDEAYSEPYGYEPVNTPQHSSRHPGSNGGYGPVAPQGGPPDVWQPQPQGMPDRVREQAPWAPDAP